MSKVKVIFTDSVEYKDASGKVTFSAEKGDTKTLDEDFAQRWIRRNKAMLPDDFQKSEEEKTKETEEKGTKKKGAGKE